MTDLIARVSWPVEHFPEVAELDINPVICRGDELIAVDATGGPGSALAGQQLLPH